MQNLDKNSNNLLMKLKTCKLSQGEIPNTNKDFFYFFLKKKYRPWFRVFKTWWRTRQRNWKSPAKWLSRWKKTTFTSRRSSFVSLKKLQDFQDELEKVKEEASESLLEVQQMYNELSSLLMLEDMKSLVPNSNPHFRLTAFAFEEMR